jgi:hypothetical protein
MSRFVCPPDEIIAHFKLSGRRAPGNGGYGLLFEKGHVLQPPSQKSFAAEIVMCIDEFIPQKFELAATYQLQRNPGQLIE